MTAFKVSGYRIAFSEGGEVDHVSPSSFELISRIGTNTLDATYIGHPKWPLAVELSDYNFSLDDTHFTDLDPPHRIELYDLVSGDGTTHRVISLVFEDAVKRQDVLFSVAEEPLPSLSSKGDGALFLASVVPIAASSGATVTIALAELPGVTKEGVFAELPSSKHADGGFEFKLQADVPEVWPEIETFWMGKYKEATPSEAPFELGDLDITEAPISLNISDTSDI